MINGIDLKGAVDIHIHSNPSLFHRIADDQIIAGAAAEAGMAAIVLKSHHESTVSRAYLVQKSFTELKIFGGIVLNSYVGGINPAAVEAALGLGGKVVWMPTIDAAHQAEVFGSTGSYGVLQGKTRQRKEGISVMKNERLIPEAIEVLELVAKYDAILGTCHISVPEIRMLVTEAHNLGVQRILITHPLFRVPVGAENVDFLREMVSLGAMAEFSYCSTSPMWAFARIEEAKERIEALGVDNCILMSDCGQPQNPMPPECLRIFAQCIYEKGMSANDVEQLIKDNPRRLLGL